MLWRVLNFFSLLLSLSVILFIQSTKFVPTHNTISFLFEENFNLFHLCHCPSLKFPLKFKETKWKNATFYINFSWKISINQWFFILNRENSFIICYFLLFLLDDADSFEWKIFSSFEKRQKIDRMERREEWMFENLILYLNFHELVTNSTHIVSM